MQDIITGAVIIGLGLFMGNSVLQGHFGLVSIFFDGLGLFFLGKGAVSMLQQRGD